MIIAHKDIHNHLLPGVDDGFRTAEDSLEAISRLSSLGCRELVLTPHMNPDVYPDKSEADFKQKYEELKRRIPEEWGVKTSLAAEYMIVKDFEQRASDPELLTYEDGSILVEMSYYYRSFNLEKTIFELNMAGKKPILAHPERYIYMLENIEDFSRLRDMGCRFQLNYLSLTGAYGPESMEILTYLLKKGWYDFTSTDLHSLSQLDRILESKLDRKRRKLSEGLIASL